MPAFVSRRKLTRDEGCKLEKSLWEMICGSENALAVSGFLKTYFKIVTNLNDYVKAKDDDDVDFEYDYRDNMIAQFKKCYFNKSFSHWD